MAPSLDSSETPESTVVIDAALRPGIRGRGQDALFEPAAPLPLAQIAIDLQTLALAQIERIERDGEPDDLRCNCCLQAWVQHGVPPQHLESCPVGRALHNSRLIVESLRDGAIIPTYPLADALREGVTHQERTAQVAAVDPFSGSGRIHEVAAR